MKKLIALLVSSLFAAVAFAQPAAADKAVATGQPGFSPSEGVNPQNQKMQAVNDPDAQPALTQHQVQKIKEKRAASKAKKTKKKSKKKAGTKPATKADAQSGASATDTSKSGASEPAKK